MYVIRHNHERVEFDGSAILEKAVVENQRTSFFRQDEFVFGSKSGEVGASRLVNVR